MHKRFVSKRTRRKKTTVKTCFFFILALFFFFFSFHIFVEYWKTNMTSTEIFEGMLKTSLGQNEFYEFLKMRPTEFFFSSTMGINIPKSEMTFLEEEETGPVYEYVPDPSPSKESKNPLVYLYNTHQTEGYNNAAMSEYDLVPTVLFASYFLREKLNDYSIPTMVETTDISEILHANGWSYSSSYEASRYLLKQAMEENLHLTYFLDIHRDSATYEATTTEYQGKKYAKVLFVIGKEHQNYEQNLKLANRLNEKLKLKVNTISRGVIGKEGKNVNGIYNQDLHSNVLLLEIGGKDNTIVEVTNTMEVLAEALKEYMEENN